MPFGAEVVAKYAREAPEVEELLMHPTIGWISGFDLETELEARELTEHINRFLADLPAEDRKLFVRRYWYSCSVTELAAITHATPNQISVRLFRIREKLRRALMKEGLFV